MRHWIIALVAGIILAVPSGVALAHTVLKTSNIEAGATLAELPPNLELTFGKPVGLAKVEIVRSGIDKTIDVSVPRKMASTHKVDLPELPAGAYTLSWRAVAQDGHIMKGEISFTLAQG